MNEMPSVDTSVTFLCSVANKNPQSNLEMLSLLEQPESVVMAHFPKKRPLSEGSDVNSPSNTDSSSDRCPPEEDVPATSNISQSEENENHQCKKMHLSLSEEGDPVYHEDDVNPSTNKKVFSNGGPPEEDMDATSTRSHSEGIEIHQRGSPSPVNINFPDQSMDLPNQVENKLRDTFYLLQTKVCIPLKITWAFLKSTADVFVAILEPNNIENMENTPLISHTEELLLEEVKIMLENEEQSQNTTFSMYSLNAPSQITGHKITDLAELNKYGITTIFYGLSDGKPKHFEKVSEFLDKFYSLQTKGCKQKFDTQHAWAFIESPCGGEPVFVGLFKLEDCKKMGKDKHIHTEKLLLEEVKQILKNNEKLRNTQLFIYTLNSPCLRNSGHESCMDLLIKDSAELYKSYGIKTIVGYSKWYGSTGQVTTLIDRYISSFNHFNLIISSSNYKNYCDEFVTNTEHKKSHDSKSNFEDRELPNELYILSKQFLPNISEVPFRLKTFKDIHKRVTNKFMSISNYHKKDLKTGKKEKSLDLDFSIPHFGTHNQFQKVGESLAEHFDLVKHIGGNLYQSKVHFKKWWTKTIADEYTTFLREDINRRLSEDEHRIAVLGHIKKNTAEYLQFCHLPLSPFHKLFN
ncbi:uncharacterized protein LOC115205426 [Salmo trutta]|uniref:uncharacterized protein LOC115205426 n=1 Tax=Salmo trutta TaxID=8032 RepID=UPI001130B9F1|nr:uncharacterized protein LOC115205426 [Salmo trutta]